MDGRGGCCIARYADGAYDTSKVNRIMLKYRPIAPKPAINGSVSTTPEINDGYVRTGRGKRRYTRDSNKRGYRKRSRVSPEEKKVGFEETVVTLPLLPETPDRKKSPARGSPSYPDLTVHYLPLWMDYSKAMNDNKVSDRTVVMPQPVRLVGSCVTVECVTDTCVDGEALGGTDDEKRKSLEGDTCPGFISDGLNRVQWTNEAYGKMVCQGEGEGEGEGETRAEMVGLVVKERLPVTYPAFACRLRLQYSRRKAKNSLTVPCDIWRMDGGGFAWRLDVKAALSLGR
ncbi:hypothetical protein HHK36_025125 [Tetracentron sinense]|uniref:DUF7950 domain-containing protein n=1 Tax=Tetracentron sinense TaxID=13715 RepID=A0A835D4W8_TETSI|nr:hypothetical protein HHK36_025125 [Tetracentron sinense]